MKTIIFNSLLWVTTVCSAQLPYSWTPNTDPGWTPTNAGSGGALQWRAACNAVTTNCTGQYANNQNTTYTSFTIDASCTNATTLNISFFISGNAENSWDFLFMEYSLDGGITWTNPYGPNVGLTGNAGTGLLWTLPAIPTSNTFRFRFQFTSDPSVRASGYRITNFQITCNVVLPIELVSFTATHNSDHNYLKWITASEINNDYFELERSVDGENWELLTTLQAAGNSSQNIYYNFRDFNFQKEINYYKLTQVDFDGMNKNSFITSINNKENKEIISVKIYDMIGREQPNMDAGGLFFIITEYKHDNPQIKKIYITNN